MPKPSQLRQLKCSGRCNKWSASPEKSGLNLYCPPNAQPRLPTATELRICQNPAVNFILMLQHLLLSYALSPPLYFPPSALHFPSCCHGEVFAPALYYLCQQRVRVAVRLPLGSTDSDGGNADRVTSHVWTGFCPLQTAALGISFSNQLRLSVPLIQLK